MIHESIQKVFPDQIIAILGGDVKGRRFFFITESDRSPATYYLFDRGDSTIKRVVSTAPWIDPKRMRPMKLIS
jgi:hypothetical protein